MSKIREHVPREPGHPVVVKHAGGQVTLINSTDRNTRGATIDCPYDSCRNGPNGTWVTTEELPHE